MTTAPPKPAILAPVRAGIPAELREWPQWVVWRLAYKAKEDKWTKVPYNPATGTKAAVNRPKTWAIFDAAWAAYERGGYDGVGFVFTDDDPFVGIDLDKAVAALTPSGALTHRWAKDICTRLITYTEISPTSSGLHLITRGTLPPGRRRRGNVEMYSTARFFTVTGRREGCARDIIAWDDTLTALHQELIGAAEPEIATPVMQHPREPANRADVDVLERARGARNGALFAALFDRGDLTAPGAGDGSQNSADLALCNLLRFWTGGDPAQMDRLFRLSALMRPKWDQKRGALTYGEKTITLALPGEVYAPGPAVTIASPTTANNGCGEPDAPDARDAVIAVQAARIAELEATVAAQHRVITGAVAILETDMTTEAKVIQMALAFRQHHGFGVRRPEGGDALDELRTFFVHQPSEAERLHVSADAIQTVMGAATDTGAAFTKRAENLRADPWTGEVLEQPHRYVAYPPVHDHLGETLHAIAAHVPDELRRRRRQCRPRPEPQETMGVPPAAPACDRHPGADVDRRGEHALVARCTSCAAATQAVLTRDGAVLRPITASSGRGPRPSGTNSPVANGLSTAGPGGRGTDEAAPPAGRCPRCRVNPPSARSDAVCWGCVAAAPALDQSHDVTDPPPLWAHAAGGDG